MAAAPEVLTLGVDDLQSRLLALLAVLEGEAGRFLRAAPRVLECDDRDMEEGLRGLQRALPGARLVALAAEEPSLVRQVLDGRLDVGALVAQWRAAFPCTNVDKILVKHPTLLTLEFDVSVAGLGPSLGYL
jgi:hypothetical protein